VDVKNIVVFASGSGSNFQAVINAIEDGRIQAEITGLIASKPGIGAIKKAEAANIPYQIIRRPDFDNENQFTEALNTKLNEWNPDLIVLAGYMVRLPEEIIRKYPKRIINIHPSLLPKYGGKGYYGLKVHQAVLESGDQVTGCSVHYVNEIYDDGPVIEQIKVPVLPGDTPQSLSERVLKEEHKLLPAVINKLLTQN
jgi:phosphoribosylglycinamide formyltransferase 1